MVTVANKPMRASLMYHMTVKDVKGSQTEVEMKIYLCAAVVQSE